MLLGVGIYLLNQIAVFCNQQSRLLLKFVFKISVFYFNVCAWQHGANLINV